MDDDVPHRVAVAFGKLVRFHTCPCATAVVADGNAAERAYVDVCRRVGVDADPECGRLGKFDRSAQIRGVGNVDVCPTAAAVGGHINARKTVHASIEKRGRVHPAGVARVHFHIPCCIGVVIVLTAPRQAAVGGFVDAAPLCGRIIHLVVVGVRSNAVDSAAGGAVGVGAVAVGPAGVDVGPVELGRGRGCHEKSNETDTTNDRDPRESGRSHTDVRGRLMRTETTCVAENPDSHRTPPSISSSPSTAHTGDMNLTSGLEIHPSGVKARTLVRYTTPGSRLPMTNASDSKMSVLFTSPTGSYVVSYESSRFRASCGQGLKLAPFETFRKFAEIDPEFFTGHKVGNDRTFRCPTGIDPPYHPCLGHAKVDFAAVAFNFDQNRRSLVSIGENRNTIVWMHKQWADRGQEKHEDHADDGFAPRDSDDTLDSSHGRRSGVRTHLGRVAVDLWKSCGHGHLPLPRLRHPSKRLPVRAQTTDAQCAVSAWARPPGKIVN